MFILQKAFSHPGTIVNEDFYHVDDNLALVIDGSTGLDGKQHTPWESDSQWFSNRLGNLIISEWEKYGTIPELLHYVASLVKKEYVSFLEEQVDQPYIAPSASIAVMLLRNEAVELFQLGDCPVAIELEGGKVVIEKDDAIGKFDQEAIHLAMDISTARKISYLEAVHLPETRQKLRENRMKMNQPDGYHIFDLHGNGIKYGKTRYFGLSDIRSFSIMSDGFAAISEVFHIYPDIETLHEKMSEYPLAYFFKELNQDYLDDSDMSGYPRLKPKDDATAVWVKVGRTPG